MLVRFIFYFFLKLFLVNFFIAELSEVLWNRLLATMALKMPGYFGVIAIYLIFWFWALLTIAILIMMEGLSAFLHTLRLHW